ncbi:MAG: NAD/NADP octopine/nopaline dehydrogenase family protein [Lachnospiraceae bacterium]|nr:NAD/NADP octopine/nopaline dehydrogenase family protein [Lachnospiraceae bacterium]
MRVTIVGGGNVGTQLAVHSRCKGHEVCIFTSRPEAFQDTLTIVDEKDEVRLQAVGVVATDSAEVAFAKAELVFVTVPAFAMPKTAKEMLPYAKPGMKICLIPGTGGGECAFSEHLKKGAVLFGLQRVPSVARLLEYGKTVRCSGYRDKLVVSAIPGSFATEAGSIIEEILDMPCDILPSYLAITLTPSNPILHTTRLYSIFKDYRPGKVYENLPLFYEGWDDASSEMLLACDAEVQEICKHLPQFDLSGVRSLKEHYESENAQALTRKISGIASFRGLKTPSVAVEGGYVPDLQSRYFTADFPYGLCILQQIAAFADIQTPHMDQVMNWYRSIAGSEGEFSYAAHGITNTEEFVAFYKR